mgnify:FL=1
MINRVSVVQMLMRLIEAVMYVAVAYMYGLNPLAGPYVAVTTTIMGLVAMFAVGALSGLLTDNVLRVQRVNAALAFIDLALNIALMYYSMVVLKLIYILILYMIFFINIAIDSTLIALYVKILL